MLSNHPWTLSFLPSFTTKMKVTGCLLLHTQSEGWIFTVLKPVLLHQQPELLTRKPRGQRQTRAVVPSWPPCWSSFVALTAGTDKCWQGWVLEWHFAVKVTCATAEGSPIFICKKQRSRRAESHDPSTSAAHIWECVALLWSTVTKYIVLKMQRLKIRHMTQSCSIGQWPSNRDDGPFPHADLNISRL